MKQTQLTATLLKSLLNDLHTRCTAMKKMLAVPDFGPPVDVFALSLAHRLTRVRVDIKRLLSDPAFGDPLLLKQQFAQQTSLAEQVLTIEAKTLPVVLRFSEEDLFLSSVCEQFITELGFKDIITDRPLPLVSAFSADYYFAIPEYHLIFAPILETQSLLRWPDMIHEIVHWYLDSKGDEIHKNFINWLWKFFTGEKTRSIKNQRPISLENYEWVLEQWDARWHLEFCTDLISTYLLGPAYVWQHLRLSCQEESNIYVPSLRDDNTHPADEMRFGLMLQMLIKMELNDEATLVEQQWRQWESIVGPWPCEQANYYFCYPSQVTKHLVETVFQFCEDSMLKRYVVTEEADIQQKFSLSSCLNEAWKRFINEPGEYDIWEQAQLAHIRGVCLVSKNSVRLE